MKKLMIAAAIVCAAAMSQAAQYQWVAPDLTSGYAAGNTEENATGMAYLFRDVTGTEFSAVKAAVLAGTFLDGDYIGNEVYSTDFVGEVNVLTPIDTNLPGVDGDTFYTVVVADGWSPYGAQEPSITPTDKFAYVITNGITLDTVLANGSGANGLVWGSQYTATKVDTAWTLQAAAVPEPTSGLLLLLGVAGMALRRRRA